MTPVSVKAVVFDRGRVLLVRNHRGEWELPGGRPDPGEALAAAARRELLEETGLRGTAGAEIDRWTFEPVPGRPVDVVAFTVALDDPPATAVVISAEHVEHRWVDVDALDALPLPAGYREAVRRAHR